MWSSTVCLAVSQNTLYSSILHQRTILLARARCYDNHGVLMLSLTLFRWTWQLSKILWKLCFWSKATGDKSRDVSICYWRLFLYFGDLLESTCGSSAVPDVSRQQVVTRAVPCPQVVKGGHSIELQSSLSVHAPLQSPTQWDVDVKVYSLGSLI